MAKILTVRIVLDENGMPSKVTAMQPGTEVFREIPLDDIGDGRVGWILHEELNGFDLKLSYDINPGPINEDDE